ncbi:MAG TPA: hypothetical protein VFV73_21495 [Streptosporangiaceae bacterium]|nr:hypothetical protein [Streptosporangiaceae bacterium]
MTELNISARTRNELIRSLRCMDERGGFAFLSQRWRTLQLVTMSPGESGDRPSRLVLTLFEHKMIN